MPSENGASFSREYLENLRSDDHSKFVLDLTNSYHDMQLLFRWYIIAEDAKLRTPATASNRMGNFDAMRLHSPAAAGQGSLEDPTIVHMYRALLLLLLPAGPCFPVLSRPFIIAFFQWQNIHPRR